MSSKSATLKVMWFMPRLSLFMGSPICEVEKTLSIRRTTNSLLFKKNASTGAVLDSMLEMQAKQRANGGPKTGEMEYDDTFICDNVSDTHLICLECLVHCFDGYLLRKGSAEMALGLLNCRHPAVYLSGLPR